MVQCGVPCVFVGVCVCLLLCFTANNGQRYAETLDLLVHTVPVDRVDLGLPDTNAYVGKIFQLSLTSHPIFGQDNVKLKITEVDKTDIPHWLSYNSTSRQLIGVATSHDLGPAYIQVSTVCLTPDSESCHSVSDVFQITVKYKSPRSQTEKGDGDRCEDETVLANLVLCVSPDSLTLAEKLHLISGMADFLSVHPSSLTLLPSSGQKLLAVEKGYQIISAGPGTGGICDLSKNIELSWYLACTTIKHIADFDKILQHNINVGRIQKEIGQTIVGWYVASPDSLVHFQKRRRRQTRQRTPVPTPVLSPVVPTRVTDTYTEERIVLTSTDDFSSTKDAGLTTLSSSSTVAGLPQIAITITSTKLTDQTRSFTPSSKTVEIISTLTPSKTVEITSTLTPSKTVEITSTLTPSKTVEITSTIAPKLPPVYTEPPVWAKPTEIESVHMSKSSSVKITTTTMIEIVPTKVETKPHETDLNKSYSEVETQPPVTTEPPWTSHERVTKETTQPTLSTGGLDRTIPLQSTTSSLDRTIPLQSTISSLDRTIPLQSTTSSLDRTIPLQSTTSSLDRTIPLQSTTSSLDRTIPLQSSESTYHPVSVLTPPPAASVPSLPSSKTYSDSYSTPSSIATLPTMASETTTDEMAGSGSGHDDTRDDELDSPASGMTTEFQQLPDKSVEEESTMLVRPTALPTDVIGIVPTKSVVVKPSETSRVIMKESVIPTESIHAKSTLVIGGTQSTETKYIHTIKTPSLEHTTEQTLTSDRFSRLPTSSEDQLLSPSVDVGLSSDLVYSGSGSTEDAGDLASHMARKTSSYVKFSPLSSTPVVSKSLGADFFFESDSDQARMSRHLGDLKSSVVIASSKSVEETMESGSAEMSGSGQSVIDDEEGSGVSVNASAVLLSGIQTVTPYIVHNATPPLEGSQLIYTHMSSTPVVLKETVPLSTSLSVSKLSSQNTSGIFIPPSLFGTDMESKTPSRSTVIQTSEMIKPQSTSGQLAEVSEDTDKISTSTSVYGVEATTMPSPASPERNTTQIMVTESFAESKPNTRIRDVWQTTTVPYTESKTWQSTDHTGSLATFTTHPHVTWPPFSRKTSTAVINNSPFLENPVDFISASLGKYFEFPVPRGVFYDIEDGDTRALKLSMTLPFGKTLPSEFWLQLDPEKQVITGLPLTVDLDTSHNMMVILVAEDSGGLTAKDAIKLYVNPSSFTRFTHTFIMTFAVNFADFMKQRNNLSFLLNKLSSYFGDTSAEHILVMDIEVGSLVLSWSNTTLNGNTCHTKAIGHIYHKLVRKDGKVRNSLNRHLGSNFRLKDVKYEPRGVCAEKITLPPAATIVPLDKVYSTTASTLGSGLSIWAQVVLPVMIALLLLLLILLIILLINRKRKRRRQKQKLEKPIFTNDRHPVIFPDELEGEETALKPKKPIVLPNDNNRSLSSSPRTTYYFEDDSPSDNASNTGTGSRTGSGRRKPKSPPPYYQPHSDPPPYRLPPPYLTNNSSTV